MTEPTNDEIDALVAAYLGDCGPQATRVYSFARAVLAKWGTPPAVAGNRPYAIQWDAELGRTAMRFVDRAGDVHPGIDDAETICAEFHAAMSAVIERMPHVKRMSHTQAQAGAVTLTDEQIDAAAKKLAECMEYPWEFMPEPGRKNMRKHAQDVIEAAHGIKGGQHG
ncbi:hypothetical protein ACOYR4_13180 [Acidovorax sp. M14]|uniref:hypothetical protein n=1 Tax=Acidovorax sp. M14 TaxID=3411354 RepID=UPI003BF60A7C